MLEILILIKLGTNIAAKAREKGRNSVGYVFLLLALWFGGEIFGAIVAAVISVAVLGDAEPNLLLVIAGGLGCAAIGAVIAFQIVKALPSLRSDDYEEYEEYDDRYEYPDDRNQDAERDRDQDQDQERGRDRRRDRD